MAIGTKLWKKLDELGYDCNNLGFRFYKLYEDIDVLVCICLDSVGEEIETYGIVSEDNLYDQEKIDHMQIAFNRLQRDIKELEND